MDLNFSGCHNFVNWLSSYLSHRKQRIRLDSIISSLTDITPQGSVLRPHLFSMFMSTYSTSSSETTFFKYAAYVTIIVSVDRNVSDDLVLVNEEINNFIMW